MSICFSHKSADLILTKLADSGAHHEPVSSAAIVGFEPDMEEARSYLFDAVGTVEDPELIVPEQRLRAKDGGGVVHVWRTDLPESSLWKVEEGIYVSSPEFTLLQQARELHFVRLCQMLGRYMGTHKAKRNVDGNQLALDVEPMTTEELLYHYLGMARGLYGTRAVREALRYTCPNAASPQETNLQLALCLPYAYHGFRLPRPEMNHVIPLDPATRRIHQADHLRVALYWDGFGLEYQGEGHRGQMGEDYGRLLALHEEGCEVWFVAKEQMRSAVQMDCIAREVARRVGKHVDLVGWPREEEVQRLLDILSGAIEPGKRERSKYQRRGGSVR